MANAMQGRSLCPARQTTGRGTGQVSIQSGSSEHLSMDDQLSSRRLCQSRQKQGHCAALGAPGA
jgi:hypothetical protein